MKKFLLLLVCFLGTLASNAQTFHRPDYERIQSIGKPAYKKLIKRFLAADTTLTTEEIQNIYFGSAFYGYGSGDFGEKEIREKLQQEQNTKPILKHLDKYLKSHPVDLRAIFYHAFVNMAADNEQAFEKDAIRFAMLRDMILMTGDGDSDTTAWHVVDVADEYTLMWYVFDVQPEGQVLTSTQCDMINVSTKSGIELQIYFDVQLVLALQHHAFFEADKPFHFTYVPQTGESKPVAGLNLGSKEDEIDVIEIDDTIEGEQEQEPIMDEEGNYIMPEIMPEFPGGQDSLISFLSSNVKFPEECVDANIQGRVIVQFVVDKDGSITDVQVAHSAGHTLLDNEAIRVVRAMPNWTPGKHEGKTVRVRYTIPINFKLQDSSPAE